MYNNWLERLPSQLQRPRTVRAASAPGGGYMSRHLRILPKVFFQGNNLTKQHDARESAVPTLQTDDRTQCTTHKASPKIPLSDGHRELLRRERRPRARRPRFAPRQARTLCAPPCVKCHANPHRQPRPAAPRCSTGDQDLATPTLTSARNIQPQVALGPSCGRAR
jgi:hypothetical protein